MHERVLLHARAVDRADRDLVRPVGQSGCGPGRDTGRPRAAVEPALEAGVLHRRVERERVAVDHGRDQVGVEPRPRVGSGDRELARDRAPLVLDGVEAEHAHVVAPVTQRPALNRPPAVGADLGLHVVRLRAAAHPLHVDPDLAVRLAATGQPRRRVGAARGRVHEQRRAGGVAVQLQVAGVGSTPAAEIARVSIVCCPSVTS